MSGKGRIFYSMFVVDYSKPTDQHVIFYIHNMKSFAEAKQKAVKWALNNHRIDNMIPFVRFERANHGKSENLWFATMDHISIEIERSQEAI